MNRKQKQKKNKNENIHSRQLFIYTFELSNELCRDWHTNVYFLYTFLIFATRLLSREQLCLQTEAVIDLVFSRKTVIWFFLTTQKFSHTHTFTVIHNRNLLIQQIIRKIPYKIFCVTSFKN